MLLVAELSGWLGMFLVLAGYACFSLGWIAGGRTFHSCNLIGSTALIVNGYHHSAWPFVALNVAWAAISTIAMFRIGPTRRRGSSAAAPEPPSTAETSQETSVPR